MRARELHSSSQGTLCVLTEVGEPAPANKARNKHEPRSVADLMERERERVVVWAPEAGCWVLPSFIARSSDDQHPSIALHLLVPSI